MIFFLFEIRFRVKTLRTFYLLKIDTAALEANTDNVMATGYHDTLVSSPPLIA